MPVMTIIRKHMNCEPSTSLLYRKRPPQRVDGGNSSDRGILCTNIEQMSNYLLPGRRERSEQRSESDGCLPMRHQIDVHRDAQAGISIKYISKRSSVSKFLAEALELVGRECIYRADVFESPAELESRGFKRCCEVAHMLDAET
jgi:hypothetical protein